MLKTMTWVLILALLPVAGAQAQEENPDFRIRAQFRDSADESVGNATVKVISRFLQVYYGGVMRSDEYRFQLEIDSPQYANQGFEVKIDDFLVGTHVANSDGFLDVTYRSDYKPDDASDLPLPAGFPDSVDAGNVVSLYNALTHDLLLSSIFGEEFERGDSDHDGDVDNDDYAAWDSGYGGSGLGPAAGDFTGDNQVNGQDFLQWQRNYSGGFNQGGGGGGNLAAVPEPTAVLLAGVACLMAAARRTKKRGYVCSVENLRAATVGGVSDGDRARSEFLARHP